MSDKVKKRREQWGNVKSVSKKFRCSLYFHNLLGRRPQFIKYFYAEEGCFGELTGKISYLWAGSCWPNSPNHLDFQRIFCQTIIRENLERSKNPLNGTLETFHIMSANVQMAVKIHKCGKRCRHQTFCSDWKWKFFLKMKVFLTTIFRMSATIRWLALFRRLQKQWHATQLSQQYKLK